MTTQNTHHTPNSEPAFRYPSPDELRYHVARGKRLQSEAVASGLATAARQLSGALAASWRWLLARHRAAELRRALMMCSDRTLADIGIAREHIDLVARGVDPQAVEPETLTWRGRGAALLARLDNVRQRQRERRRVYRELMDYSENDLNDLGISRRDIPLIARSA